jgi:hypothetical protein
MVGGGVASRGLWLQWSARALKARTEKYLRESIHISCTVAIVAVSSVMLTFLLLDNEPVRCQKGVLSDSTAVSLREVADRPADKAAILSEE